MRHPAKPPLKPRRPVGDAIPVEPEPPPSAPAGALVIRLPVESKEQAAERLHRQIARRTGKRRSSGPIALPRGPYAQAEVIELRKPASHQAVGQLRSWLAFGFEAVWLEGGRLVPGKELGAPEAYWPLVLPDGTANPRALAQIEAWLREPERKAA